MSWHCQSSLDSYPRTRAPTTWDHGNCSRHEPHETETSLGWCYVLTSSSIHFRYALVLIAMYNVWDLIGRYVPLIKCLKLTSRKGLMAATLARFLFIPAFYFTSKYGGEGWMIMLTSVLGLTNGYLTVCVLTDAPTGYKVSRHHLSNPSLHRV